MYLLDTNVISEVRRPDKANARVQAWLAAQAVGELFLSAITVLEIERGIYKCRAQGDELQAALLTRWLELQVLPSFAGKVLPVDGAIARRTAQLPWVGGKEYRDPLIAATALAHGLAVVTRNVKDFEKSGVRLINPWEEQQ